MFKFSMLILLAVFFDSSFTLRFKRDSSSFASNFGGPVAKTDKNSTSSGSGGQNQGGSYNDLEACEIEQQTADNCRRFKRDNSAFASNFGGPVAKSGKNDTTTTTSSRKCKTDSNQKKTDTNGSNASKAKISSRLERRVSYGQRSRPLKFWPNLRWKRQLNGTLAKAISAPASVPTSLSGLPQRSPSLNANQKLDPKMPNNDEDQDLNSKFGQCLAKTKKTFADKAKEKLEKPDLLKLFKENLNKIKQLKENRLSVFDAQFDESTKFCDLPFADFVKSHTGVKLPDLDKLKQLPSGFSVKKPKSLKLQWTDKNVFGPARDQGTCGSCYAVSTSDLLAAQSKIESKNFGQQVKLLSPQYIVDCLQEPDAFKCDGGRPINIVNNLAQCQKGKGQNCMLPEEDCYPYKNVSGQCKNTCKPADVKVSSAEMLDIRGPMEKDLMANLLQWGPVLAIVGVTEAWQFYNGSGVIRPRQCTQEQMHAVLVTGYDYTTCVPTYTIRNSWGADWGAKGYVKLEAGKNTCSVAKSVMYVCSSQCGSGGQNLQYVTSNANFPQD